MINQNQVLTRVVWLMAVVVSAVLRLAWGNRVTAAGEPRHYEHVKPGQPTLIDCDVAVYGGTPADPGLGSPTGLEFGTRSAFPPSYRQSLIMGDWQHGYVLQVRTTRLLHEFLA